MKGLGKVLREERQRQGVTLEEVSRATRIRLPFLRVIEEDNLEALPPGIVRKGFIEAYARFLGLDPVKLLGEHKEEPPPLPSPPSTAHKSRPYLLILSLALLVLCGVVLLCLHWKGKKMGSATSSPEGGPTAVRAIEVPLQPRAEAMRSSGTEHTLLIEASQLTWIEIRKGDAPPYDITLYPGERYKISDPKGFTLKIGNAGGVRIFFDGKDLGRLGESGEVKRLVLPERPKGPPRPSLPEPSP